MTLKKANYTIPLTKKPKKVTFTTPSKWLEDYTNIYGVSGNPVTQESLSRLAGEYVVWAKENKNAYRIGQFWVEKGVPKKIYHQWFERYETLRDAHELVMELLASRREIGALERKLDAGVALRGMPIYDKEWRKLEEWRSSLKAENHEEGKTVIVVPSLAMYKESETTMKNDGKKE